MRNSHAPAPKKKRRANKFRPSISLVEFAETEGLNLFALTAAVGVSLDLKSQYSRNGVAYYHIAEIREWLASNTVPSRVPV